MPLSIVEPGKRVRILSVSAGRDLSERLASLGIVPGTEIEVLQNVSRGPFIVSVKGSRIMMGRGMACRIFVA
ncbi:MAG: FeoA domain protein [Syntrophaceae bacterium PtaU1.Bin231]|nr:MAG: FeoA domain protein [Syntrophaceae bacterium PtaU1.Bin231]HOI15604.1 FeoA family protein [Geobacteraceae bacterium]